MADVWLVPATVELFPIGGGNYRLSILWTNGQRGKLDGPADDVRAAQGILLSAMSEHATVNVGLWPRMKIGSGTEWDW